MKANNYVTFNLRVMCNKENVNYIFPAIEEQTRIAITSVGYQSLVKGEAFPSQNYPEEYLFRNDGGRILNEYQLLYITNGKGVFQYGLNKQICNIDEGKMFLLKPGVWHSYKPNKNTDWTEYWIGFNGKIIQDVIQESCFADHSPAYSVGHDDCIIDLFQKALNIGTERRIGFQQVLAGVVMHLLGQMVYLDKTPDMKDEVLVEKINKSKVIMRESIYNNICPEEIAKSLNISYSGFRRAFKKTTGTSPLKHILDLKLNEAKFLLVNTPQSIKQISYALNFETPEYFNVFFKKRTGFTPLAYREGCFSKKTKPIFEIKQTREYVLMSAN